MIVLTFLLFYCYKVTLLPDQGNIHSNMYLITGRGFKNTIPKSKTHQFKGMINVRFGNPTTLYPCNAISVFSRRCEEILDGVFQEISEELEPSFLLEKMYHLEFKDT